MTKDQLDRSAYFSNLDVVVPNTYLNHTGYQVVGFLLIIKNRIINALELSKIRLHICKFSLFGSSF